MPSRTPIRVGFVRSACSSLRLLAQRGAGRLRGGGQPWLLALPALAVLLPVSLMVALGRFDGLYGQDAFAYFEYATGPLRQALRRWAPPPPFFWPPGYPLLVALVSWIVGPVPLAGQIVSLAAGALVPVCTALLAREVTAPPEPGPSALRHHPSTGAGQSGRSPLGLPLAAGMLAACAGQLWQSSAVVMTDTTGLALATLGVWALARYGRRRRLAWLALAAAALAWAILTRWAYALVAMPCAVYALHVLRGYRSRKALVHGGAAALLGGLVLWPALPSAVSHLLGQDVGLQSYAGDLQVVTWHPLNALRREFVTVDGLLRYRLPNGLYYGLAPAHPFLLTPLMAPPVLAGLWACLRRRTPALLWLVVGWAAVVLAFLAGVPWQNLRFTLAYLPPLAVLGALGLHSLQRAGRRRSGLPAAYLATVLLVMAAGGVQLTQQFIGRKHDHLATVRWVEAQAPADARLLTFGLTLTFQHYSGLTTLELFEQTPAGLAALLADGRPTFLLLDVAGIEAQWSGLSPQVNYRWLLENPGLEALGTRQGYTLFRVGVSPFTLQRSAPPRFPASPELGGKLPVVPCASGHGQARHND